MMTTRLYLDSRQTTEGSPAPLKISIYLNHRVAYLSTGFRILPDKWDAKTLTAKDKATMLSINRFKLKVDTTLFDLSEAGKLDGLSACGIRDILARQFSPAETAPKRFLEFFKKFGQAQKKPRTREIYAATAKKIELFDTKAELLNFEDIDIGWLDRFDSFLMPTSPKKNARNIHFRNIRAAFNEALKKGLTMSYPFRLFQIRPEPTMKRALNAEQLRTLFNAEVKPWQQKYIDFFKVCFMLIGINTEDILQAKRITGDRLEYWRAKTNKPYSIKIEPECQELLDKYKGEKYLINILDTYASTHNWTSKIDNELKTIAEKLGLPPISVYWCRHSWVSIATELDIPDRTISESMGHFVKTVTDIYVDFDQAKVDRANRKVLDYVLYNKKDTDIYDMLRTVYNKAVNS